MAIPARSFVALSLLLGTVSTGSLVACGNAEQKESKTLANEAVAAAGQGRLTEAEELLEDATATYRDNHNAWYNLGFVREQMKNYEGAAEAYSEAARVKDSDAMYHYKLGKAYWNHSNISQAQSALERAVQLNKRLYGAQYHLGQVYEKAGKPKEAAGAWSASAMLAPTFGRPFIELGNLYIKWDKLDQAVSVLDQGRINVRDGEDLTEIYYSLGMAYTKQGSWDKAIDAYSNAIQTRPSNLDALRQRGFAYAEKQDVENAKKDLKSFVDQGGGGDAFHIQAANQRLFRLSAAQ
ncbi:MAG: tetratricopeptide repeat protein [Myxococcales bacterium]|nr:tetratricopeptide repeat protein [Myxococcales bacterium]